MFEHEHTLAVAFNVMNKYEVSILILDNYINKKFDEFQNSSSKDKEKTILKDPEDTNSLVNLVMKSSLLAGFTKQADTILSKNTPISSNRPVTSLNKVIRLFQGNKVEETSKSEAKVESGRIKDLFKTEKYSLETIDDIKSFIDRTDKNNNIYFNFIDYHTLSDRELIDLYHRKKNTINKNLLQLSRNSERYKEKERNINTANDSGYNKLKKLLLNESLDNVGTSRDVKLFTLSSEFDDIVKTNNLDQNRKLLKKNIPQENI